MNWSAATDTELLTVIFHEPNVPLSWILEAAEEYRRRHPGLERGEMIEKLLRDSW